MTTYIFSEKLDKSKSASENVKKYNRDRKTIVEKYIKAILSELDGKIVSASRKFGQSTITFNYCTVPFTFKSEQDEIVFNELKTDEHACVLDSITKYLTKEGFKWELPDNTYNTSFYKSYITIHWNVEDSNVTTITSEYAPNMTTSK